VADRFDRGPVNRQGEERDAVARLRWLVLGEKSMHRTILRSPWAAPSGLVLMLLMGTPMVAAQAPGASPPRQQPPAAQPNRRAEQERLARQVEELRRAGRFDEAVAVAERALELERGTGEAMGGQVAEALARLAELHELRGGWVEAVGRRKEALAVRERVDGKGHWRTADARLAVAFAEKVAGLGATERAKVQAALAKEEESARLDAQGKFAESERVALEALETYRAVVGPESAEVARAWHRIGQCRSARHDAGGAKEANERALAIRRKVLPGTHPDLGRSLNNLGLAESSLGNKRRARELLEETVRLWRSSLESSSPLTAMGLTNLGNLQCALRDYAGAKQSHEQALAIRRKSLPPDHPDIAFSLGNLGLQGLKSGVGVGDAVPGLAEATDLLQAEQLRLAVGQAEQEQLATAALAKISLGNLLSATLITSAEPASAYDRVVRVKGSVTAQQRWARQARVAADPDTTRLLDRLRQVTRQIVGLSMDNRPAQSKSDPKDVPDEIRTLSAERDELERQLTERSAVYRTIQARAGVGSGEVRTALPEGSALIDLVDYSHLEPPAKGQTEPSEEQRMVAFVVRPDRPEVVIVPLEPSQTLAALIDRWRASYGAGKAPPAGETDPGVELRKRLWEPLAAHLEGVEGGAGVAGRTAARAALGRPPRLETGHLPGPRACLRRRARPPALARAARRQAAAGEPAAIFAPGRRDRLRRSEHA